MSSTPPPPAAAEPSLQERAQQLKAMFPALFGGAPKPLKLRIQADIQQRAPGVFTKQVLSAFLRRLTGSHAYLMAITRGTHRFDLDGAPAGEISEEHRQAAAEELARRRGNTEARRALEEEQRHNRATLLRDFERTTLTPANFCALKGIALDELEGLLEIARSEARELPPARPDPRHPPRHGQHPEQTRRGPHAEQPRRGRGPGEQGHADRRPGQRRPDERAAAGRGPGDRAGGGRGPDRAGGSRGPGDRPAGGIGPGGGGSHERHDGESEPERSEGGPGRRSGRNGA